MTKERKERDELLILRDEDGNEVEFEYLDTVKYQKEEYVVLLPLEDDEEDGEVVILKLQEEGEETSFLPVENEADLQQIFLLFKEQVKELFDFVD